MMEAESALLTDLSIYYEKSYPSGDLDFRPAFEARINKLGKERFIEYLFRKFADPELSVWLDMLRIVWKDFSFAAWLRILENLSDDRGGIYQFLWFASGSLALDLTRLSSTTENVQLELQSEAFRKGGNTPMSRATRAPGRPL